MRQAAETVGITSSMAIAPDLFLVPAIIGPEPRMAPAPKKSRVRRVRPADAVALVIDRAAVTIARLPMRP